VRQELAAFQATLIALYARRRQRQRRAVDAGLVVQLVQAERRVQPRLGTRKLYDFIHENQMFEFRPSDYVNDPYVISQHNKMVAINVAIALQRELSRRVCLVDANLQFGDHRVFLDLGLDQKSIVDAVSAPSIDADLLRGVIVEHDSKIDLLLAPPTPEQAELVTKEHLTQVIDVLRGLYDYVVVDVDKRLDDMNLGVFDAAEQLFVVLTADLSCLKNVRLVLETLAHIGYEGDRVKLILNRSNAFTGINAKTAEGALRHPIDLQVLNEYRGAISALNSGAPVMATKADSPLGRSFHELARAIDRGAAPGTAASPAPVR